MPTLRIFFRPQRYFLTDVPIVVALDSVRVFEGGFLGGFDVSGPAAPGAHVITSEIRIGGFSRNKRWTVELGEADRTVELVYSRFWGNFKGSLIHH